VCSPNIYNRTTEPANYTCDWIDLYLGRKKKKKSSYIYAWEGLAQLTQKAVHMYRTAAAESHFNVPAKGKQNIFLGVVN